MNCIKKDGYDYYYEDGKLVYTCKSIIKHFNQLSLEDPLMLKLNKIFKPSIGNYNLLRTFYWAYCDDYDELSEKVEKAIKYYYENESKYLERLKSKNNKKIKNELRNILKECLRSTLVK